jgi:hypothetical protein
VKFCPFLATRTLEKIRKTKNEHIARHSKFRTHVYTTINSILICYISFFRDIVSTANDDAKALDS